MNDALDADLDAYLDRELSSQPDSQLSSSPEAEKSAERLQNVLALATEEEQWLRTLPPEQSADAKGLETKEVPIPEHLKVKSASVKPAPVVPAPVPTEVQQLVITYVPVQPTLPGLMTIPVPEQPWNTPVAPAPSRRGRWLAAGALAGVSTGVLAAGLLWLVRDPMPEPLAEARVPRVAVTAVPARSEPTQPEALVASWSAAEPLPGPVVPGRALVSQASQPVAVAAVAEPKAEPVDQASVMTSESKVAPVTQELVSRPQLGEVTGAMARASQRLGPVGPIGPSTASEAARASQPELTASSKAEVVKSHEAVKAPLASAETKPQQRRLIEDPYLEDTEDETPFLQQPSRTAPAPAPVAKVAPAPSAPSKPSEYEDLDEDFARMMGFTPGSKPRVPATTGVTSVWIPPDPASQLPESLTPELVQQVVVANQPAIVSCIKRFKDSVPGVSGGKFVVRWFVHPDGSTYGQLVETKELRGTALASCIERLVPGWKFPQHRVKQQTPIRFPFIF